jgi:cytochrome c-type biogenesis protein CcmF
MSEFGTYLLGFSFIVNLYVIIANILGLRKVGAARESLLQSGRHASIGVFFLVSIASLELLWFFATDNFGLTYISRYSSRDLPFLYKLSAFWGGQEGSLLLWAWLISLFSMIFLVRYQRRYPDFMPYFQSMLSFNNILFLGLLITLCDPFVANSVVPANGQGLNPLLQNFYMIIHPPALYFGYVGFTVPFSLALAQLISGKVERDWLDLMRQWSAISWFFLGVGILLGAKWAYVELGWGGYWGWDPVENASLMPWITATAYLHSVIIEKRRNMAKIWDLALVVITYCLCIFGTFITRSGIISSVHAFAESNVGPAFLSFIAIFVLATIVLIVVRYDRLKSQDITSYFSKEAVFIGNNVLLLMITLLILVLTMFPLISQKIMGQKITFGPEVFNETLMPVAVILILLTGICPLIAWQRATARNFRNNLLFPLILALVCLAILIGAGIRHWFTLTVTTLALFTITGIFMEFVRGLMLHRQKFSQSLPGSLFGLILRSKSQYGGYIVHVGIMLMLAGISGGMYNIEKDLSLKEGQTSNFEQYQVNFSKTETSRHTNYTAYTAELTLKNRTGQIVNTLHPEKRIYDTRPNEPANEVAIHTMPQHDVYVVFAGMEEDRALFRCYLKPLIQFIWIGSYLMGIGALIIMLPAGWGRKQESPSLG